MQIVIQAEDAPPNIGGIAIHVWELARALAALGHSVRLLTTRKDVSKPRNLAVWFSRTREAAGIEIHEVPVIYSPRMLAFDAQLRWRFTRRLQAWLAMGELDVLAFHFWDFDSRVVAPLAGSCPIVFTNHSSQFLQAFEDPARWDLLRRRIGFADAIIAPSQELREKTLRLGYPVERCVSIPNGVDPEKFQPDAESRRRIRRELGLDESTVVGLCARRAVVKNGLAPFARALQRVTVPPGRRLAVLFAGLGPAENGGNESTYAAEVRQALNGCAGKMETRLLGEAPHEKICGLMQASDFAVLPSLQEATSLAGLEAMACELPLVASRVGGIPELVDDGAEGLLVTPGDEAGLARAVERMIANAAFRREAGGSARRKVLARFTWKSAAEKSVEVYRRAIEAHRARRQTRGAVA